VGIDHPSSYEGLFRDPSTSSFDRNLRNSGKNECAGKGMICRSFTLGWILNSSSEHIVRKLERFVPKEKIAVFSWQLVVVT
jgi:hypothetical protein